MKKIYIAFLTAFLLLTCLSQAGAQEFGTIRALQQRGEHVTRQKNEFIARVLTSYNIKHDVNDRGAVVRIYMAPKWLDIRAVEIVPQLKISPDNTRQVAAHELYFFTDEGILNLVSELIIR